LIELAVNSSHRIDIVVIQNDQSVLPDYTPTYKIYDADTGTLLREGTSTLDPNDIGRYYVTVSGDLTGFDRTLKITWRYDLDGITINGDEYTVISTPYATVDEVIDELGLGTEPTDLNFYPYAKLRAAERLARFQIDNYTGRTFGQRLGAQIVYGNNSDTLIFTEAMTAFTKVEQDDQLLYDSTVGFNALAYNIVLTETGQAIRLTNTGDSDVSILPPSATWTYTKPHFVNGSRYKIYGTLGYRYVPVQVKQAAMLLINDHLFNDSLWRERYISEFDTGQMSVKLRDTAFTGTGNLLADDLLDPFKITGIVVI
jgi:hypothetical protein